MSNFTQPDLRQMEELMTAAGVTWWSFDFTTREFYCTEFTRQIFGLEQEFIPNIQLAEMVREDYCTHIYTRFAAIMVEDEFNEKFPITTVNGDIWVHLIMSSKSYDTATQTLTARGTLQRLEFVEQHTAELLTLENGYKQAMLEKHLNDELMHHLPIGYFRIELLYNSKGEPVDYLIKDINARASQIIDCNPSDLIGKTARDLNIPIDSQLPDLAHIPSGGHILNQWMAPATNCYCRTYTYNTPLNDADIVILMLDITESVITHRTLDANENLLRNIFLNIPVGVAIFNCEGHLEKMNAKWCDMFGMDNPDQALGLSIYDNPNIPLSIRNTIRKGQEVDFKVTYDFKNIRNFYENTHDGSIDCLTRVRFLYNDEGKMDNMLVINIDNTEVNRSTHRIAQFEDTFQHISTFARVGYASYNLLTKEGFAQGVWYENYGELANTPLRSIIGIYPHLHEVDRELMQNELIKLEQGAINSLDHTLRIIHDDGRITWTRTTLICRRHAPEEGMIEMIGINYDITELIMERERAEESNRMKSAFLANMSHEIRTPLNAIVGFSELIAAESGSTGEQHEYLDIIHTNNQLLLKIISDILDLAKIEAGTALPETDNFDLAFFCRETAMVFAPQAPEGVRVVVDEPLANAVVDVSREGLMQILSNYMYNAIKFTEHGQISIGIRELELEFELYVSDTGIGIPTKLLTRIFDRFVKANHFSQGTGLGLAICKELAEQMGVRLGVVSTIGRGSRFSIFIPKK